MTEETLKKWLQPIEDPEMKMSLVDLGLIYSVNVKDGNAKVEMTLTSPGCPVASMIVDQVKNRLIEHHEIKDASVELVWEPKWDPKTMASEEALEKMGIW